MRNKGTFTPAAMGITAAALAFGLCSCGTMKSVSQRAGDSLKVAGEAAKKANPMRLVGKRKAKKEQEAAQDVTAELADVDQTGGTPQPAPTPSRNTLTPGAQPPPGTASSSSRSSLTLPSHPNYNPTPKPALPEPAPRQPTAMPDPQPAPVASFDLPRLDDPPALPASDLPPLSNPTSLVNPDDGFINLTPKLPGEEEPLLPE